MDEALNRKLKVLADAAKYDASCASAGALKRKGGAKGLGSTDGHGIAADWTAAKAADTDSAGRRERLTPQPRKMSLL